MNAGPGALQPRRMSGALVVLLAFACGASVANLYYAQPLLRAIAASLHTSPSTAALLITASQIGYAAGLLLLVPLGDLVDRRRLVPMMLVVASLGLALAALSSTLLPLALALALAGLASTAAQVLVPFAGTLASEAERGRVVGQVMSGLLLGILLARTVSGLITSLLGWRAVFGLAAAAMLLLAAAMSRALPGVPVATHAPYGRVLLSIAGLIGDEPLLRRRMLYGGLGMGTFTVVWTALALLLSLPPYSLGEATIGLFGLAGVAGALAAQIGGRAADRGGGRRATGLFLAAVLLGWGLLALGGTDVAALIAGLIVLDLGVQGQHILNQTLIYELRPDARSRLTTAYMTGNFLCAALASAGTAAAWRVGGWGAVCALGATLSALAFVAWLTEGPQVSPTSLLASASAQLRRLAQALPPGRSRSGY